TLLWRVWGTGEPLVLRHGGSGSWTHWIRNIPALARHFELWVPDLPGLGSSAMPPRPFIPKSSAAAVVTGIDALLKSARLSMAGFSFGGHVAGLAPGPLRVRGCAPGPVAGAALRLAPAPPA